MGEREPSMRELRAERQKTEGRARNGRGVDLVGVGAESEKTPFVKSTYGYETLADAFPEADPGLIPFGSDVLVQIRTPRQRTSGGLYLPEESRETDLWNMQVAKVVALGPVAFKNRETLKPWPEGEWATPGQYVRVPKYGGDRWWVEVPNSSDGKALFVLFNDMDLKGLVPEDRVLDVIAYI